MNSNLDALKEEIRKAGKTHDSGEELSLHQRVAREIIRSERSYFYGDRNSKGRLRDVRNIIEDGFRELMKDHEK